MSTEASKTAQIEHRIVEAVILDETIRTKQDLQKVQNRILKEFGAPSAPPVFRLLETYLKNLQGKTPDSRIIKLFRKRAVRSLSGVSVISLLTKFWGCPGKCVYCPTFPDLPKSYVPSEPAVMRAELNAFDPARQVQNRLRSLESTGHAIAKCDVRIIGWTWSVYPKEYQESVIQGIYDGHTTYETLRNHLEAGEQGDRLAGFRIKKGFEILASKSLEEAQKRNTSAQSRVVGIAIETRPDWITPREIEQLRRYGVTRVEIGYQTTHEELHTINKRGHGNIESMRATRLLKNAGFKVVAHMMPNLLGSTPEVDKTSLSEIFENQAYRPDELKIYPMVVTENSELTEIWKDGWFIPYPDDQLIELMAELESKIPEYVRLNRSYRDIPASQILAGSKLSNLREHTGKAMQKLWLKRRDISAREIRAKQNNPGAAILETTSHEASDGIDYFLQYIDPADRTIFWLLRLRIPGNPTLVEDVELLSIFPILKDAAIIREVHVFGDQLPIGAPSDGSGQHMGFGKKMLATAEEIIKKSHPEIRRIAVIAWVGARPYYERLGYKEESTYMVKHLL